ncbi:MAG: transglutaminaseTgpA domain-containing protein [Haloarculaceae archaeon]
MSVSERAWVWVRPNIPATRALTLLATAGLLGSVLSALYGIVQITDDPTGLVLLTVASILAATALARVLRVVLALALAAALLSVGMAWYVLSLPYDPQVVAMIESNLKLLSGQSILEIERSTIWALSVTPTPMFVTWYLSVRRWYTSAALVGGATVCYFVLTGDATLFQTLLGVVSAGALLGFGDLDRSGASLPAAESVAVVLAVMVVAPLAISVTPAGSASTISLGSGGGGGGTVEASIVDTDSSVDIVGDIELSPKVRYTVTAPESRYWRVSSFDRYTGDGWVRTGEPVPPEERPLQPPPDESRRIQQTFEARSDIGTMPAAWRPVDVAGNFANRTRVTSIGGLEPAEDLDPGDSYRVTSAVPAVSADELVRAGTDDPEEIADQYTQLPESTPDRVARRSKNVTAVASNRYEQARAVEQWLKQTKEYSLDVDRPDGNVADAFLFEMDAGYCTYYATTMVTMLRSQGVPARMTVGYTPGEEVDDGEYVVRGYNSHAWVEVYFPDHGWVPFDPTPPGPRVASEQERLDQARENEETGVDTNETDASTSSAEISETETPAATPSGPGGFEDVGPSEVQRAIQGRPGELEEDDSPALPPREHLALGAIVLVGAVAGLRKSGLTGRAYRSVWVRHLRRSEPEMDIERAFDRVSYLLERRHRPRRAGETVRQYLDAVGASRDARRVAELRERARYGDEATREMADEAVELVDRVRRRS